MQRVKHTLPAPIFRTFVEDDYDRYMYQNLYPPDEAVHPQVGLIGIPFDTSTMARRGSKYGPEAVRRSLAASVTYNASFDVDLDGTCWVDCGDIDTPQTNVEQAWVRMEEALADFFERPFFGVVIGGDHGVTYPALRALAKSRGGKGGVIVLDCHYDVRVAHHGEQTSGVPFRRLVEEVPELSGHRVVQIGINGWHNAKLYRDYCAERGIQVITAAEVHRGGVAQAVERSLERMADADWVYLTVDIDAVDPAFAPGTNANHNVGGLTSWEIQEMVYQIGQHQKLVGMDVTEVSPVYDPAGITSELAATLILNCVAGHLRHLG
ncbi:MAG: agmatinase family protein [Alicyclobacillus macrosporangiidus]|uniref:agmatinase family protein n=1 Tax=Alicyclobacillus macrosporangiidus TaxID=392015 RepID=UPI0026E95193|nr:agmatinase family protein [Alicyclobacillus macrosporangiidus]MCL6597711.1 agmatinase family protein [Alicyclobacillus macrosporangiidus]